MLEPVLTSGLGLLGLFLVSTVVYLIWLSFYWRRKGIPSYGNVITGVFTNLFQVKKNVGECLQDIYFETKPLKYYGTFLLGQPVLVLQDKDIIKQVLLKDYFNFASHGLYYNKTKDPLSGNLFSLAAADWKFMRTKLTPAFTSGKVKYMFKTVQDCISIFHTAVDRDRERLANVVNMRELLARLGTDIISRVAFGIESHSLDDDNAIFRKVGRAHLQPGWLKSARFWSRWNIKLTKLLGTRITLPEVENFFLNAFPKTVKYREENNVRRNDFIDLLIELKNDETKTGDEFFDKRINDKDIAAQAFIFFIAGFETSASTVGFALFELAKNHEMQRKVQKECDQVMAACGGIVTFEAVQSMEYTDRVLHETMRIYPALCFLSRGVTKSCYLPNTDVYLEKETTIWIPLLAMHQDEENFANPQIFDPDRFSEENKGNIPPYAYMPFGDGPRHCIGMRFALVQMKAVVLEFLTKYDVDLANDDRTVEFHPSSFITSPKHDMMLKVTPRLK